jgi:hypothetical protein
MKKITILILSLALLLPIFPKAVTAVQIMPMTATLDCSSGSPKVTLNWDYQSVTSWQVHRDEVRIDIPLSGDTTSWVDEDPNRDFAGPHNYYVVSDNGNYEYQSSQVASQCPTVNPGLSVTPQAITVAPGQSYTFSMTDYFDKPTVNDFPPNANSGYCRQWQYTPGFKANLYNPANGSVSDLPDTPNNEWGFTPTPLKTGTYQYYHYSGGAWRQPFDNRVATQYYEGFSDTYGANPPGNVTQQRTVTAPTTPGTYEIRVQSATIARFAESYHTVDSFTGVKFHCGLAFTLYPAEGDKGTQSLSDDVESKTITLNVVPPVQTAQINVQANNPQVSWKFSGPEELCTQSDSCINAPKSYVVNNAQGMPTFRLFPYYPPLGHKALGVTSTYSNATSSIEQKSSFLGWIKKAVAQSAGCNGSDICTLAPNGVASYNITVSDTPQTCRVEVKSTFNGNARNNGTGVKFAIKGPQNQDGKHDAATMTYDLLSDDSGVGYEIFVEKADALVSLDGYESKLDTKGLPIFKESATCKPGQTITFTIPMISKAIMEVEY